jgi:hypothetical protein
MGEINKAILLKIILIMKTYFINICPCTGIGIGYIVPGDNEAHACAELSWSLRAAIKIANAGIHAGHSSSKYFREQDLFRAKTSLRILRKPGRFAKVKGNFYPEHSWPKVTIKEITHAITAAYVKEVWLGNA